MRAREFISESKGIFGRKEGDAFVDDLGHPITFKNVDIYPSTKAGDMFPDQESMDDAISQVTNKTNIESINARNSSTRAFAVATFVHQDGKEEVILKYFNRVPSNLMGSWKNNEVPRGWKLQTKTAQKARSGLSPQDLIKTDKPFVDVESVIATVEKNGAAPEIVEGLRMAAEGKMPVFRGQAQNLEAIRDQLGEIIQPIAIVSGLIRGDIDKAGSTILQTPFANCRMTWPMSRTSELIDSSFYNPDNGASVGISSKGGKGAAASVGNLWASIKKADREKNVALLQENKTVVDVVKTLVENPAKEGPLVLALDRGLISQELANEVRALLKKPKISMDELSPEASEMFRAFGSQPNAPGYNIALVLLSNIAKTAAADVNKDPAFSKGCLAFLNQASIVQIYTSAAARGEDAVITGFKSVYPPNYSGTAKLDAGKNYTSTQIKGKISFQL